jgi:SRSO17 transposase
MGVAAWSGSLLEWENELSSLKERIGPVFRRRELRETSGAFIDGLLSGISRKTGWMMSEQAGLPGPWRMQALLGRSRWDADWLRDEIRDCVMESIGGDDGVLVVDDTGFLKKGTHSVGVVRQYSGTAGRIENCQVGVFLGYAGRYGQALIDRRLYLPKGWADDAGRRAKAGIPDDVGFATKPAIAREMIARNLDAGVRCAWVLADAAYGSDYALRHMLEERDQPHVLAVRGNHHLRFIDDRGMVATDPAGIAAEFTDGDWTALAAGEGSKGPRLYDWACLVIPWKRREGWEHCLLVRRSRSSPDKLAYYMVFCPVGTGLAELAGAAGLRWTIEECFQRAKEDLGLDHCEARSWHGWHRHVSLVMAAAAFLAKLAAELRIRAQGKRNKRSPNPGTDASPS